MDINEILAHAKKNQKETFKVNRYSTDVKPAKKLQRTVNPAAVKAFLDKKKNEEMKSLKAAKKKKEELQKLRDESKTTKKANSMAKRTKDNLKSYNGEDVLGLHREPRKRRRGEPPLSPEAEKKHKAFMANIVPKVKVPGINDDENDDDYKEPVLEEDERKMRKLDRKKAKARSAANLEFNDLLQLAEKQKNKKEDSSSSSDEESRSAESDSDTDRHGRPLTAEEKYQRERRKRRELEERLKMASAQKHIPSSSKHDHRHKSSGSNSLANFKIGKLNSGMSEESKRAKVKALMEKMKKASEGRSGKEKSGDNMATNSPKPTIKKSRSTPSLQDLKSKNHTEYAIQSKHKHSGVGGKSSKSSPNFSKHHRKSSTPDTKSSTKTHSAIVKQKSKSFGAHSDSETRQTKIDPHLKKKVPFSEKKPGPKKITSNPYKHTVTPKRPASDGLADPWAKSQKGPTGSSGKKMKPSAPSGKCTLTVTSEPARTNYPGEAQVDPYIERYKKTGKILPKFTPEMVERYKAAIEQKLRAERREPYWAGKRPHPPPTRRPFHDDSEDEYDSELEGFIADEEEEVDDDSVDVSSHIRAIFGYDKNKYGRESEWELSKMDASYKDIEKEEKKSLRIAREEDAREAKLEEERMKRMKKNKKR